MTTIHDTPQHLNLSGEKIWPVEEMLAYKEFTDRVEILRLWFFAHDGFTEDARSLMTEKGVLWSNRDDLNGLLAHAGLKSLPEIPAKEGVSQ